MGGSDSPASTHTHMERQTHITAKTMLTCSPDFGSLTVVNELKMPMNIFKKGTLILIFLHDTSVPVVQRNYLKLHTVPSLSLERNKILSK